MPDHKSRPILFSAHMVRALLSGEKTQTRRVVKPQPVAIYRGEGSSPMGVGERPVQPATRGTDAGDVSGCDFRNCRFEVGTRLWVRETWCHTGDGVWETRDVMYAINGHYIYRADEEPSSVKWFPSIYMPRLASRITLEITNVRVQRLQEISEEDARAEGVAELDGHFDNATICAMAKRLGCPAEDARATFALLWDSINAKRGAGWAVNPFVWAITFKRVEE